MNKKDEILVNELRRSTEFTENFIESLVDGLILMNPEGEIISANTVISKLTGFKKEKLVGSKFPFPFWPPECNDDYKIRLKKIFKDNLKQEFEATYCHKNESCFQTFNFLTAIKNAKGDVIAYILIIEHITETKNNDFASQNRHLFSVLNQRKKGSNHSKETNKIPKLDVVMDSISDGFISLDTNWYYSYVNKKAGEYIGIEPSSLIGKNIWKEYPEITNLPFYSAYHKAVATQETQYIKEYYEPFDKWFENRIYPTPEGLSIYFTDITERVKKDERLKKSERNLDNILNNIGDPLFVKDQQSRMVIVNDAFCKMFQVKKSEVIGKTMAENLSEAESKSFLSVDKEIFETGIEKVTEENFTLKGREKQIISTKKTRFTDDLDNKFLVGTIRDISEKKKTERKNQMLLSLIETSEDFIGLASLEGKPIYLNKMGKKMIGLEPNEKFPASIKDFFPKHYHETIEKEHLTRIFKADKWNGETVFKNFKTEALIPIEMSGFLIHDSITAKPIALGIVAKNITERKQVALELERNKNNLEQLVEHRTSELEKEKIKAQSADSMKSAFLATMSHELRTPMNSIIGFTGILLKEISGPLNEEQKKQISMVKNSGEQLLHLINDILDFSKIEAGKLNVTLKPFDYLTCLERTIEFIEPQASAKGLKIRSEISELNIVLVSEERRIEQIVLNLVSNAIKFSKEGTIHIKVTKSNKMLVTQVIDQGIGIHQNDLKKLFVPFTQLEGIRNKNLPGTGLGLTICKNLIEKLGGTIEVQSEFGVGSNFTFKLPLEQA